MKIKFRPKHILEVGIGPLRVCRSSKYWRRSRCPLIDAHPKFCRAAKHASRRKPFVTVHRAAIMDNPGHVNLVTFGDGASYVEGEPGRRNGKRGPLTPVMGYRISRFDDGTVDVLFCDVESCEWYVLKHLVSRPRLISLEMYRWKEPSYRHPHLEEILDWLKTNHYKEFARDKADGHWHLT